MSAAKVYATVAGSRYSVVIFPFQVTHNIFEGGAEVLQEYGIHSRITHDEGIVVGFVVLIADPLQGSWLPLRPEFDFVTASLSIRAYAFRTKCKAHQQFVLFPLTFCNICCRRTLGLSHP